jgi:hypothetical protein
LRDEAGNMTWISRTTMAILAPAAQMACLRCWAASS